MHDTTLERIVAVEKRANELLRLYGLDRQGWRYELMAQKTSVGRCYHNRRVICFSKYFLESPWNEIEDTLLHEVAHALVGPVRDPHGPRWKAMARKVGARPNRVTENVVSTATYNYILKCTSCGREWKRHKLLNKYYRSKCGECRAPIKIYRINYAERKL